MNEGMRLKRLRESLRMSQGEFAESIGLKQSLYSRVERDVLAISSEAVATVLKKYRIHPNWLFFGEGGEGPIYLEELVARSELDKEREARLALAEENRQLYKQLYDQEKERADRLK